MFKSIRDAWLLRQHYAACYHSHCISISLLHRPFSYGKTSSSSWLTHTRFLQIPINQGAKETHIKRPGAVSDEETNVVFEKMRQGQGSYGKDVTKRVGLAGRTNILVDIVLKLKDSKEVVYGALDSWVAREQTFPSNVLKKALYMLEKKQQWHRIIQVIKWMLSKGQCMTMNTYEQLLRALDKEQRSEEAHVFWEMRIGSNLHSAPRHLCTFMICMYQRNNMPERLLKLFNDLERSNRKPPDKAIIKTVADAYELLGLQEERERVLNKFCSLFKEPSNDIDLRKIKRKRCKMPMDKTSCEVEAVHP